MSAPTAETKYRPVLTARQIEWILSVAKAESPTISPEALSIIISLAPFQAKIQNAGISAAYTTKPIPSIEEKLGITIMPEAAITSGKESRRLNAYNKWSGNRSACSLDELELAHTYRYENGLMSTEEMRTFETAGAIGIDNRRST